jgi:hypothetical protein
MQSAIGLCHNKKDYIILLEPHFAMSNSTLIMPSCIGQKERQFIRDLADRNERKLNQTYTPNYKRVLKHRILQKRKTLTEDLLLINSVLDKLQSL